MIQSKSHARTQMFLMVLVLCLFSLTVHSQTVVLDISTALENGEVSLESIAGNGSSSGMALNGFIKNNTAKSISIKVNLDRPLYFRNSGPNQNMVAIQVYYDDGGYLSDQKETFISLSPRTQQRIVFVALCADFERDNPKESDRFTRAEVPTRIRSVLDNIRNYSKSKPEEDIVVAAQAALWMSQGVSIQEIRNRFDVSDYEEQLALRLLK